MRHLVLSGPARLASLGLLLGSVSWGVVTAAENRPAAVPGGQWQGVSYLRAAAGLAQPDRFLVTDTGGSGGGFGRGDPHHHLSSIDFWNWRIGWACGGGGAFRTEDGGLSWTRMKPPGGWQHVRMTGPQEIWLLEQIWVDRKAVVRLWHSTDAGQGWQEALPGRLAGGACLYCRGNERWVFSGRADNVNFASSDGGTSWRRIDFQGLLYGGTRLAIPADALTAADPPPNGGFVVYVFGHRTGPNRSPLVKSTDGGHTWKHVSLPADFPAGSHPTAICFATSWKGWLGLAGGGLLFTPDGGRTWQRRNLPTDQTVTAIWMDQVGHGFAAVANGPSWGSANDPYVGAFQDAVFETWDEGKTWTPVLSGQKQINAFCAIDADHVWGAGLSPTNVPNDLIAIQKR